MKIKCEKSAFLRGLQTVAKAVSAKNTIYALSGILLTAKDNTLTFSATDIEIAIRCSEKDVTVVEEGSLILPGRYILEIAKKLPETELELVSEGYTFIIRYGNSEITVNGMDKAEFPDFPEIDAEVCGEFYLYRFEQDIREVSVATSTDESRPLFTGVLFEMEGSSVNFVATDTHRLALKKSSWLAEREYNKTSFIVPNKILQEVIRLEGEDDDKIKVMIGAKQIAFLYKDSIYISRLIEGKFPNYHQVIPGDDRVKSTAEVDCGFLLSILERAFILSKELVKEHVGRVSIALNEGNLYVDSRSPEMGHIHEELAVNSTGEDIALIFNARYLLDILRVVESEVVLMKFTGVNTPLVLNRINDDNYIYLALPLKA